MNYGWYDQLGLIFGVNKWMAMDDFYFTLVIGERNELI
jgi:hypothetical protein